MGVLSGRGGVVNGASTIGRWQLETMGAELPSHPASGATFALSALEGNTDWKGHYYAYGHTPASMPGDALAFVGSLNGLVGVSGTAIVEAVQIDVNVESGEPIAHVVQFASNGTLTLGNASATDTSSPTIFTPKSRLVASAAAANPISGQSWGNITQIKRMRLVFGAKNPRYVNAATAGIYKRVTGNIFAAANYVAHTDTPSEIPTPNSIKGLRFYVTASTYWEMDWGIVENVRELGADRETAEAVAYSVDWRWQAYTVISSTARQGKITKPDTTDWWPAA
jgi:hypothetical protein